MAEAITSLIGCSHRTILVLTENYLTSDWCRFELQAALNEAALDRSHKIIAVVLDPRCLLELDADMRSLLTTASASSNLSIYNGQQPQLVQLDSAYGSNNASPAEHRLVATLTRSGTQQQVSTQTTQLATSKINFLNYNERKFWQKIRQLMPCARQVVHHALTLTTKN